MKKETLKKLVAIATSVITMLTAASCAKKENKIESSSYIPNTSIEMFDDTRIESFNDANLEEALEVISPYSQVDENISELLNGGSLEQYMNEYDQARFEASSLDVKDGRYEECQDTCNSVLSKVGYMLLKSVVADQLFVDVNDIEAINWIDNGNNTYHLTIIRNVECNMFVPGGDPTTEICQFVDELVVGGEAYQLINSIIASSSNSLKIVPQTGEISVDDVYNSYITFLLSRGTMIRDYGNDDLDYIQYELDENRVENYNLGR